MANEEDVAIRAREPVGLVGGLVRAMEYLDYPPGPEFVGPLQREPVGTSERMNPLDRALYSVVPELYAPSPEWTEHRYRWQLARKQIAEAEEERAKHGYWQQPEYKTPEGVWVDPNTPFSWDRALTATLDAAINALPVRGPRKARKPLLRGPARKPPAEIEQDVKDMPAQEPSPGTLMRDVAGGKNLLDIALGKRTLDDVVAETQAYKSTVTAKHREKMKVEGLPPRATRLAKPELLPPPAGEPTPLVPPPDEASTIYGRYLEQEKRRSVEPTTGLDFGNADWGPRGGVRLSPNGYVMDLPETTLTDGKRTWKIKQVGPYELLRDFEEYVRSHPEKTTGDATNDPWLISVYDWYDEMERSMPQRFAGIPKEVVLSSFVFGNQGQAPGKAQLDFIRTMEWMRRAAAGVKPEDYPIEVKSTLETVYGRQWAAIMGERPKPHTDEVLKIVSMGDNVKGIPATTWAARDPRAPEMPTIDIHAARPLGFLDDKVVEALKRRVWSLQEKLGLPTDKPDAGPAKPSTLSKDEAKAARVELREAERELGKAQKLGADFIGGPNVRQYLWSADVYQRATEIANQIGFLGKRDWQLKHLQALGWRYGSDRLGLANFAETPLELLSQHRYVTALELDSSDPTFSGLSGVARRLSPTQHAAVIDSVLRGTLQDVADAVGLIPGGVKVVGGGYGNWEGAFNRNGLVEIDASPEAAVWFTDLAVRAMGQQEGWLWSNFGRGKDPYVKIWSNDPTFSDPAVQHRVFSELRTRLGSWVLDSYTPTTHNGKAALISIWTNKVPDLYPDPKTGKLSFRRLPLKEPPAPPGELTKGQRRDRAMRELRSKHLDFQKVLTDVSKVTGISIEGGHGKLDAHIHDSNRAMARRAATRRDLTDKVEAGLRASHWRRYRDAIEQQSPGFTAGINEPPEVAAVARSTKTSNMPEIEELRAALRAAGLVQPPKRE